MSEVLPPADVDVLVRAIEGGLIDDLVCFWREIHDEHLDGAARATTESFARFEAVLGRKIAGRQKWPEHNALAEAVNKRIMTVGR